VREQAGAFLRDVFGGISCGTATCRREDLLACREKSGKTHTGEPEPEARQKLPTRESEPSLHFFHPS
jgi:hypothetical protein